MSAMPLRSTEDPNRQFGCTDELAADPPHDWVVPAQTKKPGPARASACLQIAYRRRHPKDRPDSRPPQPGAPSGNTRSTYASSATPATSPPSGAPDCNRPCHRLGPGGECGSCGELLTVDELLAGNLMP